ncbi:succinate dehydrogenase assembly factor 2 [Limibaculum sp. M0105]|uniref:FAD assembly factor SdhE n=1 Tax=Thermohalobaculum xanthum TaxID=2753746 RepID=A0A8J7M648_9RHOB|nr:succinate dehydrogenase assembly factor 2 [Thermohalobaculum xanthum]MBK0398415.1 succinate dehydrogenase assembly factor 2 [Thermohalobaculum xanthum]
MTESRETRLKRLKIRSWRRGTREMDLILGPFADSELARLDERELAAYEALLEENDQDLYAWVSGAAAPAAEHEGLLRSIAAWHQIG